MTSDRLEFRIGQSGHLRWCLCLIHVLLLLATWLVSISYWLATLLAVCLVVSFVRTWRSQNKRFILTVFQEQWWLRQDCGTEQPVTLVWPCYVSRWLTVVALKTSSAKCRRLVIPSDSLGRSDYRRLGVQLRLAATGG